MLHTLSRKLWRLCSRIRWWIWRRPRPKLIIRRFGKLKSKIRTKEKSGNKSHSHIYGQFLGSSLQRPICVATFNAALFSLAPAVPKAEKSIVFVPDENNHPKSILKQSPLHPAIYGSEDLPKMTKTKMKVSINLPDNEISLSRNKLLSIVNDDSPSKIINGNRNLGHVRSPLCFPAGMNNWMNDGKYEESFIESRTIFDVLKEVNADIIALQDVKAEEEKNMKPLSDLADALGMNYVFAESWAPEFGNAILSKWPIKRWKVQKIFDDKDFRNVLKATIDVPWTGEMNFYCTQLDHLDENWRMKQINAIIQSNDHPHILAGGLNSLDWSDYSSDRWTEIVRYFEEIGKPTPKAELMKFLKGKDYRDSKDFAGDCEPVVMIAKGQNVQGTCKYGTRVDYILASEDLSYKFVPGSYSVISSKGTSDHHIVKVDVMKVASTGTNNVRQHKKLKQKVIRLTNSCSSRGIWQITT